MSQRYDRLAALLPTPPFTTALPPSPPALCVSAFVQIVSCDKKFGDEGCNGGDTLTAYQYVFRCSVLVVRPPRVVADATVVVVSAAGAGGRLLPLGGSGAVVLVLVVLVLVIVTLPSQDCLAPRGGQQAQT